MIRHWIRSGGGSAQKLVEFTTALTRRTGWIRSRGGSAPKLVEFTIALTRRIGWIRSRGGSAPKLVEFTVALTRRTGWIRSRSLSIRPGIPWSTKPGYEAKECITWPRYSLGQCSLEHSTGPIMHEMTVEECHALSIVVLRASVQQERYGMRNNCMCVFPHLPRNLPQKCDQLLRVCTPRQCSIHGRPHSTK